MYFFLLWKNLLGFFSLRRKAGHWEILTALEKKQQWWAHQDTQFKPGQVSLPSPAITQKLRAPVTWQAPRRAPPSAVVLEQVSRQGLNVRVNCGRDQHSSLFLPVVSFHAVKRSPCPAHTGRMELGTISHGHLPAHSRYLPTSFCTALLLSVRWWWIIPQSGGYNRN